MSTIVPLCIDDVVFTEKAVEQFMEIFPLCLAGNSEESALATLAAAHEVGQSRTGLASRARERRRRFRFGSNQAACEFVLLPMGPIATVIEVKRLRSGTCNFLRSVL